jgi:hypothetical protein
MAQEPFKFKRRSLSVELVDKLLSLYSETSGDNDEFMELFWGKADEEDILVDLLTLARVALVHLRPATTETLAFGTGGSSGLESAKGNRQKQIPRNSKGHFIAAADEDHS